MGKSLTTSLQAKLTLAFVLVALIGIGLVAVLANRATSLGFARYLLADETTLLEGLRDELASFYNQQGSWTGVNSLLRASEAGPQTGGFFLRVLDESGDLVGSRGGQGRNPDEFTAEISLPIVVDARQVGLLLAGRPGQQGGRAEEQFLSAVNQAILWGGLGAIGVALLLGAWLAQRLTRPLRQLTQASRAVAGGDLHQQVPVASADELGQLAQDFNAMAQALETAELQRRQLLADTAHDLRTPISVIRSHLEAMLDGVFPPTPENLAVVHEETLRLSHLVDDVRTLSLAEAGQLPLEREPQDLAQLARQAVAAFTPLAEADGIILTLEKAEPAQVLADGARMQQVLANLLSNALHYAPQGLSPPPRVTIVVTSQEDGVTLSVHDNGPGLTPQQQAHVFDRFWRSDAARSPQGGGSGLGLAIVKSIVEAHNGTISLRSAPGTGTTFSIFLPAG